MATSVRRKGELGGLRVNLLHVHMASCLNGNLPDVPASSELAHSFCSHGATLLTVVVNLLEGHKSAQVEALVGAVLVAELALQVAKTEEVVIHAQVDCLSHGGGDRRGGSNLLALLVDEEVVLHLFLCFRGFYFVTVITTITLSAMPCHS